MYIYSEGNTEVVKEVIQAMETTGKSSIPENILKKVLIIALCLVIWCLSCRHQSNQSSAVKSKHPGHMAEIMLTQECIPVGCVASAAVAVSWGGGGSCVCQGGCQSSVLGRGCLPGGCLPVGLPMRGICLGVSAQGGVCLTPPPWTEWQAGVKTLPCRNYAADGNEEYLYCLQEMKQKRNGTLMSLLQWNTI